MTKREGCGFPFFVAKQAWGSPSDISPERFTFIKYANGCLPFKQSFSKRAWRRNVIDNRLYKQGLGQSVRRAERLRKSGFLFVSCAGSRFPFGRTFFLRTYALCSDVFSPVCVPPNCCFCTRPFFLLLFCRCLARKSLPINNAKTDSSQRQKTVFAVNNKLYDTQKVKQKRLT